MKHQIKTELIRGYCTLSLHLICGIQARPPLFQGPAPRTTGL